MLHDLIARMEIFVWCALKFVPESWHCYKCNAAFATGSEMMAHVNSCKVAV